MEKELFLREMLWRRRGVRRLGKVLVVFVLYLVGIGVFWQVLPDLEKEHHKRGDGNIFRRLRTRLEDNGEMVASKSSTSKKKLTHGPTLLMHLKPSKRTTTTTKRITNPESKTSISTAVPSQDHFRTVTLKIPAANFGGRKKKDLISVTLRLYSAFFDDRDEKVSTVRVHGLGPPTLTQKKIDALSCFLRNSTNDTKTSRLKVTLLKEQKGRTKNYAGFFFDCDDFGGNYYKEVTLVSRHEIDKEVNIPEDRIFLPVNKFPSRNDDKRSKTSTSMALCMKPFHNEHNRAVWLVEFMEYYRHMGVSHFIFYNTTTGPAVEKVLNHYVAIGAATILKWDLPDLRPKVYSKDYMDMVWSHILTMNDCNFRTINRFEYVVHVDFDEFLVPKKKVDANLTSLIERMNSKSSYEPASYVFRNLFFYLYWENDTLIMSNDGIGSKIFPEFDFRKIDAKNTTVRPYLLTMSKTRRLEKIFKNHDRSKYIVRPHTANFIGHHFVQTHRKGFRELALSPEEGTSNHYRICEYGGFDCLKKPSIIDRGAHRFASDLLPLIRDACNDIFEGEPCPDAPALGSPW